MGCVSCWLWWMEKCLWGAQTLVRIIWHWSHGRPLKRCKLLIHQVHLCWYIYYLRCILHAVFMFVEVLENKCSAFIVRTILEASAVLLSYRCFNLHEIIIRLAAIYSAFNVTVVICGNGQLIWHFLLLDRVISKTELSLRLWLWHRLRLYVLPEILLMKFLHGCITRTSWRLSTLSCLNIWLLSLTLAKNFVSLF